MPIDPSILRSAPFVPNFRTPGQFDADMAQQQLVKARAGEEIAQVQREQQLRAIVQKHGGDLEAAAGEIAALDPELGQRIFGSITARKQQQRMLDQQDAQGRQAKQEAFNSRVARIFAPDVPEAARASYYSRLQQEAQANGLSLPESMDEAKLLTPAPAAEAPYNLSPGQVRYQGGKIIAQAPAAERAEPRETNPTEASLALAAAKGDESAAKALALIRQQKPQAGGGSAAPPTGGLDDDGLDLAATRFRVTGTLPARDSKQNAAIMNAAAKQGKALGMTPAATIQKQAAYKGDSAALQDITKRAASAEAFEAKAIGQIPIIQELSAKVSRTSMPIINAALQSGRTEITGNSNATQLANAIETFTEEYAKIMGGSTGSAAGATDSSRAAAKRLLNTAMSKGTMTDVLALMQREMSLTMQGYDATKAHIAERMGGGLAPTLPTVTPTSAVPSYQDYLKRKGGK